MHPVREFTTCTNLSQTSFRAAWTPAAVFVDDRWESSDPHADIHAFLSRAPSLKTRVLPSFIRKQ